ncbi:MAG: aminoacyl-tRNA hydrolase [Synergistaceae bacterium]|jgi:PTH1 family peptidyl-tRNA hydrolase|nr:aminoacyl-tRNA hydrolase [Synergistaceae bacterium]PKL04853.1 MAG: aminoacyl-tRNA hydrolase [Synergistetes bacterium HGW-Synergistetes-1]MBP9559999.1 aminoacyl-tRNA hydrolase [Synergistaceae bacterium]MBP9974851.1 aminoacyl-tRNA hydrolase [Synergistaceae bacterium]MCE5183081.1 aminoacyl-tRNA hydrolase [Synergistaceae bacterium]
MKLIVGLGNPGVEYAWTRHNAGWLMIDTFVSRLGLSEPQAKFKGAFWGPILHNGERISLLKPYTYMNLSGLSVAEAVRYQNIEPSEVLVIYDDAALPFGRVRIREKGSAGGQKGMMSILGALKTLEVPRLRIGVGEPQGPINMADWVLGRIPPGQKELWCKLEDVAWEALNIWLKYDIQKAMGSINGLKLNDQEKA